MTELARRTDPVESHKAAESVKVGYDRVLILRAFATFTKPVSYYEAALKAAAMDNSADHHFRTESLRRRGSDLRAKGWIAQEGSRARRGLFYITYAGWTVLRKHDERR